MIKRIIPWEEVKATDWYNDIGELAEIFNHEVIEDSHGTWRFQENKLMDYFLDGVAFRTSVDGSPYNHDSWPAQPYNMHRGCVDLNQLCVDFHDGKFTLEEYVKFYMSIGYSLSGFAEVFGQHEAADWPLPDAKRRPVEYDDNGDEIEHDEYYQTPIMYLQEKYRGRTLHI